MNDETIGCHRGQFLVYIQQGKLLKKNFGECQRTVRTILVGSNEKSISEENI